MTDGPQSFSLRGLNALVIGGSSGIGECLAHGLQDAGARVAIGGRTAAKVAAVTKALQAKDERARGYTADAADLAKLEAFLRDAIAELGHIDILVPCQGITVLKPAEDFSEADYDAIMATNARSVFFSCTKVGRHMLERRKGSIINIGSMAAHRPDQDARRRMGRSRRASQCDLARLLPHRTDPQGHEQRAQGKRAAPDAGGPFRHARRAGRRGRVPRLAGLRIRHRHDHQR
jgi:NAD(P)-dependent dehydrogenase (short-subunit alcohol dehydrogenase family)